MDDSTTPAAGETARNASRELLSAMVELVSSWTSLPMQAEIASRTGLSLNEADIRSLHTIGRFGNVRPAALARELHLSRPTMSKSLGRLSGAELIHWESAADDRRAKEIALTDAGQAAYDGLVSAGIDLVDHALAAIPAARADADTIIQFVRALRRADQAQPQSSSREGA